MKQITSCGAATATLAGFSLPTGAGTAGTTAGGASGKSAGKTTTGTGWTR